MADNIVQTLDEKEQQKGKRGRPRSPVNTFMRGLHPDLSSRQSINSRKKLTYIIEQLMELDLVDGNIRDKATGKRMMTKVCAVADMLGREYLQTDSGKQWLLDNWADIVDMKAGDLVERCREMKRPGPIATQLV